ncbi:MAG: ABC transporter substrate-binding protein [Bacteroidales bacterium]|nr:ABC transporter substrate-binding protein [Bacteroidales bacterium]
MSSCGVQEGENSVVKADSVLTLHYATGFSVSYCSDYKRVEIFNPWQKGSVMAVYYLTSDSALSVPNDGTRLQIPLQRLGITSCTHIEFLNLLDVLSAVKGASNPHLIYNNTLRQSKDLVHLGDAFNLNFEQLLLLNPDALMMSAYNSSLDEQTHRLQEAGIKIIYNNEWMEASLLARAEWIKFVAVFFDKETEADALFQTMEQQYTSMKTLAAQTSRKPDILSGGNFKGTWYMPSGKVFMSSLFTDAGGTYYYAQDTTTGSLPLSFETVLAYQQHADVWLNAQAHSLAELVATDQRHALFDAFKNKRVYSFGARSNKEGANDFWEGAVAHPDVVLSDVIWALHPELLPDYTPVYIKKLE